MKPCRVAIILLVIFSLAPIGLVQGVGPQDQKNKERDAAIKKCDEEYKAALKASKVLKGRERSDAQKLADRARADCRALAAANFRE
jgi:hypothetical protein